MGKDWAAARREERRELPQPVVIVLNLYASWPNRFTVFTKHIAGNYLLAQN
jgi:hypothetical protein